MNSVASLWKWYLTNETRMTNFEKIIIENHDRSKIKNQSQRIILHFSQQQITREGTLDSSVKTVPPAQISRGNAFVRMVPISQTLRFLCSGSRNKVFFGDEWTRNHGKKKERKAGKKKENSVPIGKKIVSELVETPHAKIRREILARISVHWM